MTGPAGRSVYDLPTAPTYATYQCKADDELYIEMGVAYLVPSVGCRVDIDGTMYVVDELEWNVYTGSDADDIGRASFHYPMQHVTVWVRKQGGKYAPRKRK